MRSFHNYWSILLEILTEIPSKLLGDVCFKSEEFLFELRRDISIRSAIDEESVETTAEEVVAGDNVNKEVFWNFLHLKVEHVDKLREGVKKNL